MEFKDYIGHILTLTGILSGGAVAVIRWLLIRRDERITKLEHDVADYKRAYDAAIAAAVAASKADYIERIGNLGVNCGKDLATGLQRLETLQVMHVEKWSVDIGTLKRQLDEVRQDVRSAQRILGRYEVLNGRTED